MPGFASYDDLINESTTNGKQLTWEFFKVSTAPEAAGVWHSLWTAVGTPGPGAAPAATPGTVYTDAAGSMNWANVSTDQKHVMTFEGTASQNCTLQVYDRLVAVSGISVASTGNKTINSSALGRYTGTAAANVQVWLEVTTATTTTAPVCSLNQYTNEAGTTGRAGGTITFPAAATNLDAMVGPMPLQSGDKGVRSVEVGLNVGTAAAAGVVNVVLMRPIASISILANQWNCRDMVLQYPGLPRVFDGASLALMFQASGTTATNVWGQIRLAYG